jgi:quercetin dioxygenase-like cupin family protein
MKIQKIGDGVDVGPLLWALQANPHLWNQNTARTADPTSPHYGVDDIWVRYAAPGVDGSEPHDSVWHPCADALPVREIAMRLMAFVGGERLGGILITRIPPGGEVKPHTDPGWHARYYEKFAVQVASAPGQSFCFEGEQLESRPGDIYWFDNSHTHWVTNPTPHERITLICCIKRGG